MFKWRRIHLVLGNYGMLISIGAFIAAAAMTRIPSDPGSSLFLGFSIQRLALLGSVVLAGITAVIFSIKAYQNQAYAERAWQFAFRREPIAGRIRWGALILFIAGWGASFAPAYRYGDLKDYFIRIAPIIHWLTFAGAATLAVSWVEKYGLHWQYFLDALRAQKKTLLVTSITLAVFIPAWVLIAASGLGVRVSEDYWYGAGVPLLGVQVFVALAIGLGTLYLEHSSKITIRSELLMFALLWAVGAFLWAREPLQASYFSPGPYLPDFEFHPYSDAATFDLGSQFALIGQGINDGVFFDRVLYMGFLVFIHTIAGQDYAQAMALQAAIYAVFPAILYLLGKTVHSRTFGLILAMLAILRGINGIAASNMIDLAGQKQMLTDFPTAIFAAWFALAAVRWTKDPNRNYIHALWAGGIAGLAVMLRTHALFLGLFAVVLAAILYWNRKLRGLVISALLVIAMFAGALPWGIHSGGSVFDVYMVRIRNVIQGRYPPAELGQFPAATPPAATIVPATVTAPPVVVDPLQQPPVNPVVVEIQPTTIPVSLTTHFLHNVVTSVLILPASPFVDDLQHTLKTVVPFWEQYWDGSMDAAAVLFVLLTLLLIALGISVSYKFARIAGLIPLGVFIFYNMANAFARTSGGRYIVPVDWAVFFYFALGLLQVILWGLALFNFDGINPAGNSGEQQNWDWKPLKKSPWILLVFLLIGASLPLSESFSPARYPPQTQAELISVLDEKGYLQEMGLDRAALETASVQWPSFKVINGRALYPRFYLENKGEFKRVYPYLVKGYPRMAFTVIGPLGASFVILPGEQSVYFPNASDVFVLGCLQGQDFDAMAVVVEGGEATVYTRQPAAPLQCPLPEPVCDNNHVCR